MSRRKRFTGHRDHMGRHITGMTNMPPPEIITGNDNMGSASDLRTSSFSRPSPNGSALPPPPDVVGNEDYPFGRGGVYNIPVQGGKR